MDANTFSDSHAKSCPKSGTEEDRTTHEHAAHGHPLSQREAILPSSDSPVCRRAAASQVVISEDPCS
eukprot:853247-Prymnesium_polylepis.1